MVDPSTWTGKRVDVWLSNGNRVCGLLANASDKVICLLDVEVFSLADDDPDEADGERYAEAVIRNGVVDFVGLVRAAKTNATPVPQTA